MSWFHYDLAPHLGLFEPFVHKKKNIVVDSHNIERVSTINPMFLSIFALYVSIYFGNLSWIQLQKLEVVRCEHGPSNALKDD